MSRTSQIEIDAHLHELARELRKNGKRWSTQARRLKRHLIDQHLVSKVIVIRYLRSQNAL